MKKKLIIILTMVFVLSLSCSAFAAPEAFADVPAKHWAYDSVNKLAKAGIVEGYGNGMFNGDKQISRYEMAIIIAKALTKTDKADAAAKMELDKLSKEFSSELQQLGVRVTTVEAKVNKAATGNFDFSYWGRINVSAYVNPLPGVTDHQDTQIRNQFKFKNQLDDNVTANVQYEYIQSYNTDAANTSNTSTASTFNKMNIEWKNQNWGYVVGRQGINPSTSAGLMGKGAILFTSTGYDGISTYYTSPDNKNNKWQIGMYNVGKANNVAATPDGKAIATPGLTQGAIYNIVTSNGYYDLFPNFQVFYGFFKDGGKKGIANSALANQLDGGFEYKFGNNNDFKFLSEFTTNRNGKNAANYEGEAAYYQGKSNGYDLWLTYKTYNTNVVGSWNVGVDIRRYLPGVQPYPNSEMLGGIGKYNIVGSVSATDNVKGVGVYYNFVPCKQIRVALEAYYLAPVVKMTGGDGKYKQAFRMLIDYGIR